MLLIIGVCVSTILGMWIYAISLEDWGETRSVIFPVVGLLAITVGLIALIVLVADLIIKGRRKTEI